MGKGGSGVTTGSLLQRIEGREHWFDQMVVLKVLSSDFFQCRADKIC